MDPIESLIFALQTLMGDESEFSSTPAHLAKRQAKIDAVEAIRKIASLN